MVVQKRGTQQNW